MYLQIINPSPDNIEDAGHSAYQQVENVRNFLVAINDLRLPIFEASDLEQVSMPFVFVSDVNCLATPI